MKAKRVIPMPVCHGIFPSRFDNGYGIRFLSLLFVVLAFTMARLPAHAAEIAGEGYTPARLSLIEGTVSFQRGSAPEWTAARLNTPLASGDALYTAEHATLEIQTGPRAFVRAAERTHLVLGTISNDYLQLRITGGEAALDLRSLSAGYYVEIATPHGVFSVERNGYYRIDVSEAETHFITRRGGRATVTLPGGEVQSILPSEEVVIRTGAQNSESYVAPDVDTWDRWNYARTDHTLDSVSARYVSPGMYGMDELDHYGSWRVVPDYGTVWVPDSISTGWVPYSTGSWVWDPYYGWTWLDDAPWGWAPFHYGRWAYVDGFWAWAPGPVIRQAIYAPALVAFFGHRHGDSVQLTSGIASVGWVALGWGEPLVPWWGARGFVGTTWWGGWGGPRIVNTVANANYRNSRHPGAVMIVHADQFGRQPVSAIRMPEREIHDLPALHGSLPFKPTTWGRGAGMGSGIRPPQEIVSRPVMVMSKPRESAPSSRAGNQRAVETPSFVYKPPQSRFPAPAVETAPVARPPFGTREGPERERRPMTPRPEEIKQYGGESLPHTAPNITPQGEIRTFQPEDTRRQRMPMESSRHETTPLMAPAPIMPAAPALPRREIRNEAPRTESPIPEQRREFRQERPHMETPNVAPPNLPGKSANRLYPREGENRGNPSHF